MPTLSYGLNITKKPGAASKPATAKRKPIFDEDEEEDEETEVQGAEEIGVIGGVAETKTRPTTTSTHGKAGVKASSKPSISVYGDLSSSHTSNKHASEAVSVDPSIYDYDAAYDSLHAAAAKKASDAAAAEGKKPKYMASLLAAAEVRKRDQLRAKDKLLAKEREAEGDEYADKEKFVTSAYKAQQEEARRLEAEETLREEEAQRRTKREGGGMTGFYRSVLEKDEKRHEEALTAAAAQAPAGASETKDPTGEEAPETSEVDLAKELKAKGREVAFNDEGQVVDKRQLLSAGLNVRPKPKASPSTSSHPSSSASRGGPPAALQGKAAIQRAMRERQTRMMEEQLAQSTKRALDDEDERKAEVERSAKSKKTASDVSSARERYLQRKRAAEEARKKADA
ncbi:MAG: hypothetical protein M1838_002806 [Thelocarpon superellum]|nr:MAG: hypothetical protein M1838_002806 [Thelocarpon superellum]